MTGIIDRLHTALGAFGRGRHPRNRETGPPIRAFVPDGPERRLLEELSRKSGLQLEFAGAGGAVPAPDGPCPPIVIYGREHSPCWREDIQLLARTTPRPYVILLSATADANLWDELERLGGDDILRLPLTAAVVLDAVARARLFCGVGQWVRGTPGTQ